MKSYLQKLSKGSKTTLSSFTPRAFSLCPRTRGNVHHMKDLVVERLPNLDSRCGLLNEQWRRPNLVSVKAGRSEFIEDGLVA